MLQIVCKNEVESCSKTKGKLSFRRNQYYEPSMLHIKSLGLLANEMTHPQKQKKHGQFKFYEKRLVINTVDLGSVNLTLVIFIKVFVHHFARKRRFFIHRFIVYIDYWFAVSDFHLLKNIDIQSILIYFLPAIKQICQAKEKVFVRLDLQL